MPPGQPDIKPSPVTDLYFSNFAPFHLIVVPSPCELQSPAETLLAITGQYRFFQHLR